MKRHSKSSILFNKIDTRLSKTFYGNKTGFMKNMRGRQKIFTSLDESVKNTNPQLYDTITDGFSKFENSYDASLIKEIQNKFQNLIEDENSSKPISQFNNKTYLRMIKQPYKIFPEVSKLITTDVLSFLKKQEDQTLDFKIYLLHFTMTIKCKWVILQKKFLIKLEV